MTENETSAEQRLYDAASRWSDSPGFDTKDLIDGAVQALVDDLDSPSLRELAGASPSDRTDEIQSLLDATLDELNIPPAWRRRSLETDHERRPDLLPAPEGVDSLRGCFRGP